MSAKEQAAPAGEDPVISLNLPLSAANFVLASLDKNPLGVSVMQVAALIGDIGRQAETQVKQLEAAKKAEETKPPQAAVKKR